MKVVHIYGKIINCEEIRNVEIYGDFVKVHFRRPANEFDYTTIVCQSEKGAKDVMDIIYNEMVGE